MTAACTIAVLQVPPFDPTVVLGGAEAVAVDLVHGLASLGAVTVVHGVSRAAGAGAGPRQVDSLGVRALAGFPIDDHVWQHGCVAPDFTPEARRLFDDADLIVSVERVLQRDARAARIVCLGGLSYPHSVEVVQSGRWDRLAVPSPYVARRAADVAPASTNVVVVENGVDLDVFVPAGLASGPSRRLLLPARPDWSKGFERAIDLARALGATLRCFEQRTGPPAGSFYRDLRTRARGVELQLSPWRARRLMASEYAAADLTLCLGDVPEGFGLTAIESIACGTPVLARSAGFLADILPADHGLYLVAPGAGTLALAVAAERAFVDGPRACRERGRPYIARRYDARRMRAQYVDLARAVLTR
jgi:glycosyltransferase involved in cell wall biosynthesis